MAALINAVLFYQVVGGVLAPSGATSSSLPISTRVPWGMIQSWDGQLEELWDSAWRSSRTKEEREGRPKGKGDTPEGWRFLPSPFGLGPHFLFFWPEKVKVMFACFVIYYDFCQIFVSSFSDTMWSGRKAETCYECLRGENEYNFVVLSFEKAWDKIQRDFIKCKPWKNV